MDTFGGNWEGYVEKLRRGFAGLTEEDVVVFCGDLSWGMSLEEALPDFQFLEDLFPGKKYLLKGNHDYWWSGITALRRAAPNESFYFLQNDCIKFEDLIICGSRAWSCPGSQDFTEADRKIYLREGERFKLVFGSVEQIRESGDRLLCLTHYPPFNGKREDTLFTQIFEKHRVNKVVYGHLHANQCGYPFICERNGIVYYLTSCDLLNFKLAQIY